MILVYDAYNLKIGGYRGGEDYWAVVGHPVLGDFTQSYTVVWSELQPSIFGKTNTPVILTAENVF